jgi:Mg-chelatase subunit ChlD
MFPLALLLVLAQNPPQDAPVFTSNVALVRVDAEVAQNSRTVDGLSKEDFRIWDKGTPAAVTHFSQDSEPLDLVLLFDISGSMRPNIEKVAAAAHQALGELRPGDRVAVWVFNWNGRVLAPFTEDLAAVEQTLTQDLLNLRFGGGTRIQASADQVATRFMKQPRTSRRRAVIVFTDDVGQRSFHEGKITEHFWEADSLLCELIIRSTFTSVMSVLSPSSHAGTISHIVDKTGGETVKAGDNAGANFQQMMQRIRRRYTLYYPMPAGKPGEHREIKVELTDAAKRRFPDSRVRARKGYLLPAS